MSTMEDIFGEVIHTYSRAQAIDDGVLVDVSELAAEAGFKFPVAMTAGLWAEAVAWDQGGCQDETGRLWDVFSVSLFSIRQGGGGSRFDSHVFRVPNTPRSQVAKRLDFYGLCGPGDNAEPVITLMLIGED